MNQQVFKTGDAPEIHIGEIKGSLYVKGWDRAEVIVKADPEETQIEKIEEELRLTSRGDVVLHIPSASTVVVAAVRGDAQFKLLQDTLKIDTVNGSLELKDVADVQVNTVYGDCRGKRIEGDLDLQQAMGSLYLRTLHGDCRLGQIAGDLTLRNIEGDISAQARGSVRLESDSLGSKDISITANGDLQAVLPAELDAALDLRSGGQSIRLRIGGINELIESETYTAQLGSGSSTVKLSAGGDLMVISKRSEASEDEEGELEFEEANRLSEELNQKITQQIEAQMETMTRQINEQMEQLSSTLGRGRLSPEQTEQLMERARQQSERAAVRAQEKLRRAQERLQERMEAVRQRDEARAHGHERHRVVIGGRGWNFNIPTPPTPPAPPPSTAAAEPQATDEERLFILRMLEQKKISLQEAENLLSALEGKS